MSEIDNLVQTVEGFRFNDEETQKALELLRSLHSDLGLLIEAVESNQASGILDRIGRKNEKIRGLVASGAKIAVVAPALTIGISHFLSALTGVPLDSTMVSTVFGSMVAMPFVERAVRKSPNRH
jgi:hypothetical protein